MARANAKVSVVKYCRINCVAMTWVLYLPPVITQTISNIFRVKMTMVVETVMMVPKYKVMIILEEDLYFLVPINPGRFHNFARDAFNGG